jgi:hypothetical protein
MNARIYKPVVINVNKLINGRRRNNIKPIVAKIINVTLKAET